MSRTCELLYKVIHNECKKHLDNPKQRTLQWHALRASTIGGSELATIYNCNKYMSLDNMIMSKRSSISDDLQKNPACIWGTIFEDVVQLCVEFELGTNVLYTDITVIDGKGLKISPDGLSVITLCQLYGKWELFKESMDIDEVDKIQQIIVVNEFKAPYRRIPIPEIPINYNYQVQGAMHVLPICTHGLLSELVIRKCSIDYLNNSGFYDKSYHRERSRYNSAHIWGISMIYDDDPLHKRNDVKDLGHISQDNNEFDNIAYKVTIGQYTMKHFNPCFESGIGSHLYTKGDIKDAIDKLFSCQLGGFAVIPWKVLLINHTLINRDEKIQSTIDAKVKDVLNQLFK